MTQPTAYSITIDRHRSDDPTPAFARKYRYQHPGRAYRDGQIALNRLSDHFRVHLTALARDLQACKSYRNEDWDAGTAKVRVTALETAMTDEFHRKHGRRIEIRLWPELVSGNESDILIAFS
jgi:hypothetical protein